MSIRLMNLAFGVVLPPTQKLVLIRLCDYANDEGLCWPSINQLALAACISDRQTQRVMKQLIDTGVLAVVKNEKGGKAGETRHYRVLEQALAAPIRKAKKARSTGDNLSPVLVAHEEQEVIHTGDNMTPVTGDATVTRVTDIRVTPMTQTGDAHVTPRVTLVTQTGDMGVTLTTIEPPDNHQGTTTSTATVETATDADDDDQTDEKPATPVETETELQAACRETWASYAVSFRERYGVAPVRNAMINTAVKSFVQRVGYDESPKVAEFYVWINDQFLIRNTHGFQHLTKSAESYRTQWATGRGMTSTKARQIDKTQSNRSAADEAIEIVRRRQGGAK